jgi:hypothetical protein
VEPPETPVQTEIIEEKPVPRTRGKRVLWLFFAIGGGLLVIAIVFLFIGLGGRRIQDQPILSAEDLEQEKYDAQQEQQARNKASQIRNDPFVVRKGSEAEVSSAVDDLMRSLNLTDSQSLVKDDRAKAEEDLIANVIRDSHSPSNVAYSASRSPAPQAVPATSSSDADKPMFVYSRSFGGANITMRQRRNRAPPGRLRQSTWLQKQRHQSYRSRVPNQRLRRLRCSIPSLRP